MKKLITTILLTLALTSISFAGYGSSSGGFPSSYSSYSKPSSVSFSSSKPSVRTSSNYTPPKPSVSTTTAVTFSNASVVAPTTIYKPSMVQIHEG